MRRGPSLTAQFTSLFTSNDGRYEAVAGSNILTDQVNASRTLAVAAGVVANAAADADYAGKPSLALTGTQYLESNQPPSFWPSMGDGAGGTLMFGHKITAADGLDRYTITTSDAAVALSGFAMLARGPAGNTGIYIGNATGGFGYFADPLTGPVVTPSYFDLSVIAGANGIVIRRKSAIVATGTLATPSAAAPTRTLRIGANSAGASGQLTVRFLYHWRRVLTVAERAVAQAYILADSGMSP